MNADEFRVVGKEAVDYICDYNLTIAERPVSNNVEEGFLSKLIPAEAPIKGEPYTCLLEDFDKIIMPGVLHWNHPRFHAYFPSGNSYPSILGDMLSSMLGAIGFSWAANPSSAELENIVLDWYAKALDLPSHFIRDAENSTGGGMLQGSASECVLVCLIAARARAIKELKGKDKHIHDSVFLPHLVAYTSKEAHSCVEKACKMAIIKLRILDTDDHGCLRGTTLRQAIDDDLKEGLTPCFVSATLGTTAAAAFDNIQEIGEVCKTVKSIWFHVDGAYAGNSFILPEMRKFKVGLEMADSFNTNPNKLLLTSFDASAMWVRDLMSLTSALVVDPIYLQHNHDFIDHRHYSIPLSRRFRALKLWFVFRSYGISGLQSYIRNHKTLGKKFEQLVQSDDRFEVRNDVHLGLVCFRLQRPDKVNREFLAKINSTGKYHMIPAMVLGKFIIRFCVNYEYQTEEHIEATWRDIVIYAEELLAELYPEEIKLFKKLEPKKSPVKQLTRTMSSRFSFTRSVSKEIYERQASVQQLRDGATPICVLETDDILDSLHAVSLNSGKPLNRDRTGGNVSN